MVGASRSTAVFTPILLLLAACGQGQLPGHYWDITIDGTDNACTGGGANFNEKLRYRVLIEGNDLTLAVDDDIFATGLADGCRFDYSSLVWSSYRDNFEIQWQILGSAYVNVGGGGGCIQGTDWEGTETFIVTTSAHPDVSAGCTYETALEGKYIEEVE